MLLSITYIISIKIQIIALMYTGTDNTEIDTTTDKNISSFNHHQPTWKIKEQRRKFRKKIFGQHYNYNYRKPNQHKMYRIQENKNTEIERQNRILLQKIQGIFKRSMGKKKAAMLQRNQAQETHDFVRQNIVNSRGRRSTETTNERHHQKNPQQLVKSFEKPKRIQTQMQIKKADKIKAQDLSRVTKKRTQSEQPEAITKRKKRQLTEMGHRVTLFKGHQQINKTPFFFTILVEGQTYSIIAEQQNAQVQQQINIPYSDYKKLHKNYLNQNHGAILDYLHINLQTGLLQLVGFEPSMMDIVQYGQAKMGGNVCNKNANILHNMPTPHKNNFASSTEGIYSSRIEQELMEYHERKQKRQEKKLKCLQSPKRQQNEERKQKLKSERSCEFTSSLINIQILPKYNQQGKDEIGVQAQSSLSIQQQISNNHTDSMLPLFDQQSKDKIDEQI